MKKKKKRIVDTLFSYFEEKSSYNEKSYNGERCHELQNIFESKAFSSEPFVSIWGDHVTSQWRQVMNICLLRDLYGSDALM